MTLVKELSAATTCDFPDAWYEISAEGHFWLEWRLRAFLNELDALGISRETPWRGLDIGCGHGVLRRQIERRSAWTIDGADLKREVLAQNGSSRGETLLYDIHDRIPELAEHYDFVLLFDVIEHVSDTRSFLADALYHLRAGGWLFVNVPAINSMTSGFDRVVGHLRRYNRRSLRQELSVHGVDVRDIRYWGFCMLPYLVVRKLMPTRGASVKDVIQRGVLPPRPWMNAGILRLMALETTRLKTPILGTSLLSAARKGVLPSVSTPPPP